MKVGESDLLPVTANDATLNLLALPYSSTDSEMNSLAGVPVGASATDRARVYDPYQWYVVQSKSLQNFCFFKKTKLFYCMFLQTQILKSLFLTEFFVSDFFKDIRNDYTYIFILLYSENSRHGLTPSTSSGHAPGKRKAGVINNDIYQTTVGMHSYVGASSGQPSSTAVDSAKQQQPQTVSNTSSPLLVNLLR